jgi:hypothetical protein
MMTPGDFASLQEGREGLSTEDYIAWKLPEDEEEVDYPFPLTLKSRKGGPDFTNSGASTPLLAPSAGAASQGGQPTSAVNGDDKLAAGMGALNFWLGRVLWCEKSRSDVEWGFSFWHVYYCV